MNIGDTWNESQESRDPLTGRLVRRLTSQGRINQTPTYHTNSGFTADGGKLAFVSVREGATWILSAEATTGKLKALWRAPGVGDRNYIHRGMSLRFDDVDGRGVCGNPVCMAPKSQTAVFAVERSLMAVDINTCQTRVLLHDCGPDWIFGAPCVSPDERHVAIALSSCHPEMREKLTLNPAKHFIDYPHTLRLIRVPLDGSGVAEVLYEHPQPAQSAHCAFCPTDNNLLYFDLDLPPRYWRGSDGKTPRIWLLDIAAKTVRPVKTDFPGPFQIHQAWLWDGSAIAYHGHASAGGEFFGVVTKDGKTLWERVFPQAQSYGHNTPDPVKQALIIDGMFTRDRLQWLYWDGRPDEAILEPICLHNTEWATLPGQYTHPHPLTDRTGRWISFTAAKAGRTDIHVVDTQSPSRT
ncbi:MAG TPA: hypothetical protein P5137_02445 [Candidatus Brocadiia bacterium]|nr:hypothetical protein [Candidatus Brocadiia bacterium]